MNCTLAYYDTATITDLERFYLVQIPGEVIFARLACPPNDVIFCFCREYLYLCINIVPNSRLRVFVLHTHLKTAKLINVDKNFYGCNLSMGPII